MDKRVWISGYRSYELGAFSNDDPKVLVIKRALKEHLEGLLQVGQLNWVITGGQMGSEQWSVEVVNELKNDYPDVKVSVMTPFADFGSNWNENNQARLDIIKNQADFTASVSNFPYQNPSQLKSYQKFMLEHTDSALFIYDLNEENEGKSKYDIDAIKQYSEKNPSYKLTLIDIEQLEETSRILEDERRDEFN